MDYQRSLSFLMYDVSRRMRYRFDARARALGVTRQQWRVIFWLARSPGFSQAELADVLEVERITLCRMIDRMAEAGLVERRADPNDRRVWRLHLLPPALSIADNLAEIGAEGEQEALSEISPEAAEIVIDSHERLRNGLRHRETEAGKRETA
jgi:DNA-binding MarR family transcriptional regulator